MEKRGISIVKTGGDPFTRPHKVKVLVQKLGRWWQCLPRPVYKKVATFEFEYLELCRHRQAYTTLPAEFDLACLQKANARSGDALVKVVVTLTYGKVTLTEPVAEFLHRLGEEGPEGFVLRLNIRNEDQEPQDEAEDGEEVKEPEKAQNEAVEGQGKTQKPLGRVCHCLKCKPLWYFEALPVKPPTAMDTYVDIMTAECTVMRNEGKVLLKEKRTCASELAALQAEIIQWQNNCARCLRWTEWRRSWTVQRPLGPVQARKRLVTIWRENSA